MFGCNMACATETGTKLTKEAKIEVEPSFAESAHK